MPAVAAAPAQPTPAAAAASAGASGANNAELASSFLAGEDAGAFDNAKPVTGRQPKKLSDWTPETAHLDAEEELPEEEIPAEETPEAKVQREAAEKATTDAEAKAKADADAKAKTDAEALAKANAESPVPTDWPETAKQRVGQLTRQKGELTEKLTAAEQRAVAAEAKAEAAGQAAPVHTSAPTGTSPLAKIDKIEALEAVTADAKSRKAWALENWDGGEFPLPGDKTQTMTAAEVRQVFSRAEEMLETHVPTRRNFLEIEARSLANVKSVLPDYFDLSKPEGVAFKTAAERFPFIKQHPAWPTLIATALYGETALLREAAAAKEAAAVKAAEPAVVIAPTAPAAPAAPRKPGGDAKRAEDAKRKVLESNGSEEDLTAYFLNT